MSQVAAQPSKRFLERISHDFARAHLALSGGVEDSCEALLVAPETDPSVIHNLSVRLGRGVRPTVVDAAELATLIDAAYESSRAARPTNLDTVSSVDAPTVAQLLDLAQADLLSTEGKGAVVRFVDELLFRALQRGASDLHLQPGPDGVLVRCRIDGMLQTLETLPADLGTALTSRIKVMGRMDIAERRVPQDGRASVRIGEQSIDLRISTFPTRHGERTVLRLLDQRNQPTELKGLGLPDGLRQQYLAQATRSHGMVLVTGPTGSGKTTTLYATLAEIARPELNVMTIEDPVEYALAQAGLAVSQAQVNAKKGVTFASGLRHILRQDPDVVLVGEIRDEETARMAIQSSLTGHLVFSTLHTNDAPSAISRLVDLGVEPFLVSASLSAVLAQRLVRRVHPACQGSGCDECFDTGFKGRIALFELMPVDDGLREAISSGAPLAELRKCARDAGLISLLEAGKRLVEQGVTTLEEVARVADGVEL